MKDPEYFKNGQPSESDLEGFFNSGELTLTLPVHFYDQFSNENGKQLAQNMKDSEKIGFLKMHHISSAQKREFGMPIPKALFKGRDLTTAKATVEGSTATSGEATSKNKISFNGQESEDYVAKENVDSKGQAFYEGMDMTTDFLHYKYSTKAITFDRTKDGDAQTLFEYNLDL